MSTPDQSEAAESKASDADTGKLGLALSGGGFRAAAFHLGVLKRLRELGLLQQVEVISTVSGGSIIGAFLVRRHTLKGRMFLPGHAGAQDWREFEEAIIKVMRAGLVLRVIGFGFWLPFIYASSIALSFWLLPDPGWVSVLIGILALGTYGALQLDLSNRGLRSLEDIRNLGAAIVSAYLLLSAFISLGQYQFDQLIRTVAGWVASYPPWLESAAAAAAAVSGTVVAAFWLWRRRLVRSDWEKKGIVPALLTFGWVVMTLVALIFLVSVAVLALPFAPILATVVERVSIVLTPATGFVLLASIAVAVIPLAHGHLLYRPADKDRPLAGDRNRPDRIAFRVFIFASTTVMYAMLVGTMTLWLCWPESPWTWIGLILVMAVYAYFCWHYNASVLLQWLYDRRLYEKFSMQDLATAKPTLIVNATSLVFGAQIVFTPNNDIEAAAGKAKAKNIRKTATTGSRPIIEFENTVPVATAVAASSAFPAVFTPVLIRGHDAKFAAYSEADSPDPTGPFYASDGGVYDNQGIQALLEMDCERIVASDGAMAFAHADTPSTWQFLPIGGGVLQRCQDIIFQRVRDLGYRVLRAEPKLPEKTERRIAYVELQPVGRYYEPLDEHDPFDRKTSKLLPDELVEYLARFRTDLDCFSKLEISALAYHGYSLIDRCLQKYRGSLQKEHASWIKDAPFDFSLPDIPNYGWDKFANPTQDARALAATYARHLDASDARMTLWRWIRRLLNRMTEDAAWV